MPNLIFILAFPGNLPKLRAELQRIFGLIRHHPPALTYRRVCHALAWINMHLNNTGKNPLASGDFYFNGFFFHNT